MQTTWIKRGALVALIGYVLSGPVGFLAVNLVSPQPTWTTPAMFVANYHIIQDVPFYFGFLLIGGMLMLATGHYLGSEEKHPTLRFKLLLALGLTVAFVTLITFNYICQTTFVRHLALTYLPEHDSAISAFSMANPQSLSWSIEIWGYGLLGIATWLTAGYYREMSRTIAVLMVANGVVSVTTVLFTIADTTWLLRPIGLAGYFIWNVLMVVLMILIYRHQTPVKY